jgi:hypothetical protein
MAGSRVMSTTSAPRPRHRLAALAAVVVLALSGCGLRLETPEPTEPSPDAAETLRASSVDDALALADGAGQLLPDADPAVATVLTLVHDAATGQAEQLGGVYESGLPDPTPSPSASTTALSGTDELLTLVGSTAVRARSDALSATDPQMARLLAVIAAARAQQAVQLAGVLGTEVPALTAEPAADPGPEPTATDADGSGSGDGAATSAPAGLDTTTLSALTAAEDQAGFGYEVAASRLSGDARADALAAARSHRARAEDWAQQAGISGTSQDPRRVTYALGGTPADTDAVRTFCAGLERQLTDVHADAVLASAADSTDRTVLVDRLRAAAVDLLGWGGTATAFPGMDGLTATS